MGVFLGRATYRTTPPEKHGARQSTSAPSHTRSIECDCVDGSGARATTATVAELQRLRRRYEGVPAPWPEALDQDYRSSEVESHVREALEQCPGIKAKEAFVDCDEYPCLVVLERLDQSDESKDFLWSCDAWLDVYGGRELISTSQGRVNTPDGARRYWITAVEPESDQSLGEAREKSRRNGFRFDLARERLRDDWDWQDTGENGGAR